MEARLVFVNRIKIKRAKLCQKHYLKGVKQYAISHHTRVQQVLVKHLK